jgi:hypothetical protein
MRALVVAIVLLGLVGMGGAAFAEIGAVDPVPAATLLLPYFEVDLNNPNGITTLFSINNASATATVAHVTLWTDEAIPTFAFDVYLTGFDVQTINLRDIFNGVLPVTADAGADPGDTVSRKGAFSQDINYPGSTGPCGSLSTLYNVFDPTLAPKIAHIRASHQGQFSAVYGGCSGANYGDGLARGYVTVDTVNSCNLLFPSDAGYFTTVTTNQNILWGDYFFVNSGENFAQGDPLVHIEACTGGGSPPYQGSVGTGGGHCPLSFGNYSFYGRYNAVAGQDQREPLATTFASRYVNGGSFTGGTSLTVWRDTKTRPTGVNGTHACGNHHPFWFPLNQTDTVSFDEQEQATDQCFLTDNVAPVTGGSRSCFPLATQRIHTAGGNAIAQDLALPSPFGWLYLNLNFTLAVGDPYPGIAQAWVTTIMDAEGRFSVGYSASQLDNALTAVPNGLVLIP